MSVDTESMLNLGDDEGEVALFLAEHGGALQRDDGVPGSAGDPAVYWLTMRPRTHRDERFVARVEWEAYPYEPPSIKFATHVRGSLNATSAWPVMTGYRAGSFDICRPMCKEGYGIHPEWRQGSTAWPIDGNPFLWVVHTLQFHLDNDYQGRAV
jgi:hypothetical protein